MRLPETREDILGNIVAYNEAITNADRFSGATRATLLNTISRTMGWIVAHIDGEWLAGPTKFCGGAAEMTPPLYERKRVGKLNANAASAAIAEIFFEGDLAWEGSLIEEVNHPAIRRMRRIADEVGKSLKSSARFYILRGENINSDERAQIDRILSEIENANLTDRARVALMGRLAA